MTRTLIVAVVSSLVSCILTLTAVSAGLVPTARAAQGDVIQASGFEVVEGGKSVAYFGVSQGPPILVVGEHSEVLISSRSIREASPFISLSTADKTEIWKAP